MRTRAWSAALLLASSAAVGWAFDSWDEVVLLSRFKQKVRQDLSKVPDYTCLENIERSTRGLRDPDFKISDTVRLEVSEVGGKELYAWPGGNSGTPNWDTLYLAASFPPVNLSIRRAVCS